jgi:tRNA(Ile)-lysidine synthase
VLAVAYSGGLDSSVLLHAAHRYCAASGTPLLAFHVNHQLSPHAAGWAAFCQHACDNLDVRLVVREVDVTARGSIEAAAREARYQALEALCRENRVTALLTAHHANDQAETVLFNLLRGTGIAGLRGIAPSYSLGPHTLLRPLLDVTRPALHDYAMNFDLRWIEDESNQDLRFSRNALRHRALPLLTELNPHALQGILATARHAGGASELLEQLALLDIGTQSLGAPFPLKKMEAQSRLRRANALRCWLRWEGYGVLSEAVTEQWLDQLEKPKKTLRLSHAGRQFEVRNGGLQPVDNAVRGNPPQESLSLSYQNHAVIDAPAWRGRLRVSASQLPGLSLARLRRGGLELRPRAGGERMQVQPDGPTRSLKNLYQEAGINAQTRIWLPLVFSGDDLVFAAGLGLNLRFCESVSDCVRLEWERVG